MHAFSLPALLVALTDAALKSVLLLALAGGVTVLLRRRSAAARHLVWGLALGGALLLPALSVLLPQWQTPFLPHWSVVALLRPAVVVPPPNRATAPAADSEPVGQLVELAPNLTKAPSSPNRATAPVSAALAGPKPSEGGSMFISTGLALGWLAGALLTLAPLLVGWWQIARVTRRATVVTDPALLHLLHELRAQLRLRRAVTLRRTGQLSLPLTWGAWRPVLLLPEASATWTPARHRLVLLHELAHMQRWDWLTQIVAHTACAVYWFNPLAWLAARQMRLEREQACDDVVLAAGSAPVAYADELLQIAASLRGTPWLALATVPMARRGSLETRLRAILDGTRRRAALTGAAVVVAFAALGLIVVPIAMLRGADKSPAVAATPVVPPPPAPSPATAPSQPTKADASFLARLPSGGSVELLAVSYAPPAYRPWWKPDGSPTSKDLFLPDNITGRSSFTNAGSSKVFYLNETYHLYFRAPNIPADSVWKFDIMGVKGSFTSPDQYLMTPDGKPVSPEIKGLMPDVPQSTEFLDIKLGLASTAWETIAKLDPRDSANCCTFGISPSGSRVSGMVGISTNRSGILGLASDFDYGPVRWNLSMLAPEEIGPEDKTSLPRGTKITVIHAVSQGGIGAHQDWDVRVVAVDTDGREFFSEGLSFGNTDAFVITHCVFQKLPFARVKEIHFQVRPFQWVEFHHVALKPKLPPVAPVATSATFGPVIERDLPFVTATNESIKDIHYLDLASGNIVSQAPPGDIALVATNRLDGVSSRHGIGLTVVGVHPERWDATPGEVLGELAQATPQADTHLPAMAGVPTTYFFRTQTGAVGTLQLWYVEGTSAAVRARYKLLQTSAPAVAAPAPSG